MRFLFLFLLLSFSVFANEQDNKDVITKFLSEFVDIFDEKGSYLDSMAVADLPKLDMIKVLGVDEYDSIIIDIEGKRLLIDSASIKFKDDYDVPELTSYCVNKESDYVAETTLGAGGCD